MLNPPSVKRPSDAVGARRRLTYNRRLYVAALALLNAAATRSLTEARGSAYPLLKAGGAYIWRRSDLLPACSAAWCFNTTRCRDNAKVFVYPRSQAKQDRGTFYDYLPRVPSANDSLYTSYPDEACLLAVYVGGRERRYADLPKLSHCNDGENHILIDFSDRKFTRRLATLTSVGKAVLANSYLMPDHFRLGFDMSVPLLGANAQDNVRKIAEIGLAKSEARKYFLTFKGTAYRNGTAGAHRWKLLNIDQRRPDVLIHLRCFHLHGWRGKRAYKATCDRLESTFVQSDYLDLMNTTFALVPGGRQPSCHRLSEVMAAGAVPVFVYPEVGWIKPYHPRIDWNALSLTSTPTQVPQILAHLREIPPLRVAAMRHQVRQAHAAYFGQRDDMAVHLFAHARAQLMEASPLRGARLDALPLRDAATSNLLLGLSAVGVFCAATGLYFYGTRSVDT